MNLSEKKDYLSEYNHIFKENDFICHELARNLGLSECSFWILYILRTEPLPPSQSEICSFLYLPKQSINSALKKKETKGCIDLVHENSRRKKQVRLTEKGIQLCKETVDRVIALERSAFDNLSKQETELFLSQFRKYTNLLKESFFNME